MSLIRHLSIILLFFAALSAGCKQAPPSARAAVAPTPAPARAVATNASAVPQAQIAPPQRESPSPNPQPPSQSQPLPNAAPTAATPQLEDVEERKGPFPFGGQTFTVILRSKRLAGTKGDFSEALASLDIVDASGAVAHHEEFPHTFENGDFSESCSAGVMPLNGSNGAGLLIDTGCLPSAPLSGGPWQIFGLRNGKLSPIGKPIYVEGELGDFVPGKITHIGNVTQILADELRIRLFTGYFFVSVPIRVNWMEGKLALAQHCLYQTGHGFAEGGCEMPVEGVEQHRTSDELTFVRMFTESNEQVGTPAHVVIQKNSRVEILAGKVLVKWQEEKDSIGLRVGDDIWVKVRIDNKEGWIHTDEDLQAIGLYQAG